VAGEMAMLLPVESLELASPLVDWFCLVGQSATWQYFSIPEIYIQPQKNTFDFIWYPSDPPSFD
jgi:hypothetical protein